MSKAPLDKMYSFVGNSGMSKNFTAETLTQSKGKKPNQQTLAF